MEAARREQWQGGYGDAEDHAEYVRQALAAGKPVPPEVIAEYPVLQAQFAPAATQQNPTPGSHVVFDVETTGLTSKDVAIQLGAQIHVPGRDPISYNTYIDPGGVPINPEAQSVHGIGPEQLQGAPSQQEAWGELDRLIASVGGVESAVGHNSPFDIGFAPPSSSLHGMQLVDTLALARRVVNRQEAGGSYKLSAISKKLGLPEFGAHDALADVSATKRLLDQLVQMGQARGAPVPGTAVSSQMTPQAQAISRGIGTSASPAGSPTNPMIGVVGSTGEVTQIPYHQFQQQQQAAQAAQARAETSQQQYQTVLADYMRYGYTQSELRGMLKEGLGESSTPEAARDYLEQQMTSRFGARPKARYDPTLEKMKDPYSPREWRYMEEHRRVRGRAEMPWGAKQEEQYGRMPGATQWSQAETALGANEPIWTRQGSSAFYPVSTLAESGYWLPGSTPGSVKTPVGESKLAKRTALLGSHEGLDIYQWTAQGLRETSVPAAMRGGPASETPQRGTLLRAAMPLMNVTPAGMGMLGEGAIERVSQRYTKDIDVPEGFPVEELAKVGTKWGVGEDIRMFEGASPLNLLRRGAWEQAELLDIAEREGGGYRAVFERSIAPERAALYGKTGGTKETLPVGDIQAFTGRSDIEMLMQYKEPLGTAWQYMMAQQPERLQALLAEQGYTGEMPETWKEAGEPLVRAFQQMLPDITENVRYTRMVHEGSRGWEELSKKIPGATWEAQGEGMYKFSAEVPTLMMGETFTPIGRNFPTRRPFYSARELERMERVNPEMHQRVMAESQGTRETYQGIVNAALASTGEFETPQGTISPTKESLRELMAGAQVRAQARVGMTEEGTPRNIPPGMMQGAILEQAAEQYGTSPISIGGGRYLAAPAVAQRFRAHGGVEGEEVTAFNWRYGQALQALATGRGGYGEGEYEKIMERAIGAQAELGLGRKMMRAATGAFIKRGEGGVIHGDPALAPEEFQAPVEAVLRGYGIKPGSREAEEFERRWYKGSKMGIEEAREAGLPVPAAALTRYPVVGDEPFQVAGRAIHPRAASEKGVLLSEETPFITSQELTQSGAGDWDADLMMRMWLGRVTRGEGGGMTIAGQEAPFATREQLREMAQQQVGWGAGELAGEVGAGPGSAAGMHKALDVSEWNEYTPEELQKALAGDLELRERIGGIYNTYENLMRAAGMGKGGGERLGAAQALFNMTYQTAQRPKELPPALQQFTDIFRGYKPWTGGWRTASGKPGGGRMTGLAGMQQNLLSSLKSLVQPGSLSEEEAALTPRQAAELIAPEGNIGAMEEQFARIAAGGLGTEEQVEVGRMLTRYAGGEERMLESPLGRAATVSAVERAKTKMRQREATPFEGQTQEQANAKLAKEQSAAESFLANLPEEWLQSGQLAEATKDIKSWRLAMSKHPPEGVRPGSEEYNDWAVARAKAVHEAGLGAGFVKSRSTAPAEERGWQFMDVASAPMTTQAGTPLPRPVSTAAPLEAEYGITSQEAGLQPPSTTPPEATTFSEQAEFGGTPAGSIDASSPEAAQASAAAKQAYDRAIAAGMSDKEAQEEAMNARWVIEQGQGGGQKPPSRPAATAAPAPQRPVQAGNRPVSETGEAQGGSPVERILGVSARTFRTSVEMLAKNLDTWNETVRPAVEGTEEFTKEMKELTNQTLQWKKNVERGLRQTWQGAEMRELRGAGETLTAQEGGTYVLPGMENLARMDEFMQQAKFNRLAAGGDGGDGGRGGPPAGTPEWQKGALGAWGPLRGADKMVRGVTSGWELMRLKRLWGMTGGYAMGQIPIAAQQEMAAAQVASVGMPMGQVASGDMAMQLMAYQAQQQQFKGQVGEAAFGAWGWAQQGVTGGGLAQAAGIGLPAIGAGLVGGSLAGIAGLSATGVGLPIAALAALYGTTSYSQQAMGDREKMALAAAQGPSAGWDYRLAAMSDRRYAPGARPNLSRGATQGPPVELTAYGERLRSGELAGLTGAGRLAAVQEATRLYAPEWMAPEQAMAGAQAWMQATPDETNIRDVYRDPRFAAMAMRGMQPGQFQQVAQQWGMDPSNWQAVMDQQLAVSPGQAQRSEWIARQWQPLTQFGMEGEEVREMAFGRQQRMWDEEEGRWYTGRGEPELERLDALGQAALGQWGAQAQQARLLGLEPAEPELGEGAAPVEEQRLQQMPLLQAQMGLQGQLAQYGLTGAGITEGFGGNIEAMQNFTRFMQGDQQMLNLIGAGNVGGGTAQVGAMQFDVAGQIAEPFTALMDEIRHTDPSGVRALEGMFKELRPLTESSGLKMGTTEMYGGFLEGFRPASGVDVGRMGEYAGLVQEEGLRGLQREQLGLQYEYKDFQFAQAERKQQWGEVSQFGGNFEGFETRGSFAIQRELRNLGRIWEDFTQQYQQQQRQLQFSQFMENWQVKAERTPVQFGWQREDLAFQGAQQTLQYAWGQEDIQEKMRYATGRERRALMKQQDRQTIQYAMGMGRLETQGERLDVREQWAKEDLEREKRQFLERFKLQDEYQSRYRSYIEQRRALENELQDIREHGARLNIDMAREQLDMQKQLEEKTRAINAVQMAVNQSLENAVALQRVFAQNLITALTRANSLASDWLSKMGAAAASTPSYDSTLYYRPPGYENIPPGSQDTTGGVIGGR